MLQQEKLGASSQCPIAKTSFSWHCASNCRRRSTALTFQAKYPAINATTVTDSSRVRRPNEKRRRRASVEELCSRQVELASASTLIVLTPSRSDSLGESHKRRFQVDLFLGQP